MYAQYHLIEQLNPGMPEEHYRKLLHLMLPYNYRMVGAFDASKKCVGLSGFWIAAKFYSGKYLEIDNFVVDTAFRAQGIGKLLIDWLLQFAKTAACDTIMLDAYVTNAAAHRFYLREGFQIKGFHFIKSVYS